MEPGIRPRDLEIQVAQMLGADEHRSERIVDARARSAGGNDADGPHGLQRSGRSTWLHA
jgi:hypothetical protein